MNRFDMFVWSGDKVRDVAISEQFKVIAKRTKTLNEIKWNCK